jgi:acetylglutamate kinase
VSNAVTQGFEEAIARAGTLLEALPYLQSFRGKTFVIKYGGSAMEDPKLVSLVLRDLVFLELVGINPVVVHGGGKAITQRMKEKGLQAVFVAGLRVTDKGSIDIVDEVLNTVINPGIVAGVNALHGRAVGVRGQDVFLARKQPPVQHNGEAVDYGFVGDVTGCTTAEVEKLVAAEKVPVISPLGRDAEGQSYNINADIAASEIAIALKAEKIIYLSDVNGILRDPADPATRIPTVTEADVNRLKKDGVVSGGMIPKVDSCLKALHQGIQKVHLIDGRIPHALLLELFTDTGIGTEIVR